MQNISKIISYIGFAIRSGKVIFGIDNIEKYRKKIHIIVISNTIADNSYEKVIKLAEKRNIDYIKLDESLENITKRDNCKVLAITNFDLANAIKNS